MSVPIRIPKLGRTMTEGFLAEWLVNDGDVVSAGTPIYRLETDKVDNEVEAPSDGTIRIVAEEGVTYPVGTDVAELS